MTKPTHGSRVHSFEATPMGQKYARIWSTIGTIAAQDDRVRTYSLSGPGHELVDEIERGEHPLVIPELLTQLPILQGRMLYEAKDRRSASKDLKERWSFLAHSAFKQEVILAFDAEAQFVATRVTAEALPDSPCPHRRGLLETAVIMGVDPNEDVQTAYGVIRLTTNPRDSNGTFLRCISQTTQTSDAESYLEDLETHLDNATSIYDLLEPIMEVVILQKPNHQETGNGIKNFLGLQLQDITMQERLGLTAPSVPTLADFDQKLQTAFGLTA